MTTRLPRPHRVRYTRTRDGVTLTSQHTGYATPEAAQTAADKCNAQPPQVLNGHTYTTTAVVERNQP